MAAWEQSCEENLKREQEVLVSAEELKAQGSVDEKQQSNNQSKPKRIKKIREEEGTVRELLPEVLDRRKQQKEELWNELEEYIASRNTKKRRTSTSTTNIWQMTQSNASSKTRIGLV